MPAKPIDKYWENRIYELAANDPKAGPYRIEAILGEEANGNTSLPQQPTANTIRRYLERFRRKPKAEQDQYLYFHWPGSMSTSLLPWEASAAALELLDVRRNVDPFIRWMESKAQKPLAEWESGGLRWGRPTIRLARWFWHVTQAAPDLPSVATITEFLPYVDLPGRYDIAVVLAEWETDTNVPQGLRESVETYLAFAPWRSPERALEYQVKVESGSLTGLTLKDLNRYESIRHREIHGISEEGEEALIREIFEFEKEDTNGEAQG
jgi:hypothetical protein